MANHSVIIPRPTLSSSGARAIRRGAAYFAGFQGVFAKPPVAPPAPPPAKPTATIAAGTGLQAILTFSEAMLATESLTDPSTYTITTVSGTPIQLSSVSALSPTQVALNFTSAGNTVGSYTVGLPGGSLYSSDLATLDPATPAFSLSVTGISPSIVSAASSGINTITLTYSKAMDLVSATDPSNYSISGGVKVLSVARITDAIFSLTTSGEAPSSTYTLTCSSAITDTLGNHLV